MHLAEQLWPETRRLSGEAFNFSNETQLTVLQVVDRILHMMGSGLRPVIRNEANNEIRRQYLTAAKARRVLNWQPKFTLDQGLRETIAWYGHFLEVS